MSLELEIPEKIKIKSDVMNWIVDFKVDSKLTQKQMALTIGCSQERVSDLINGRCSKFSIDWLFMAKCKLDGGVWDFDGVKANESK